MKVAVVIKAFEAFTEMQDDYLWSDQGTITVAKLFEEALAKRRLVLVDLDDIGSIINK